MKKILIMLSALLMPAFAFAEGGLPADWQSWTKVTTPLVKVGAIPDCNADVSSLPPI